MPLKLLVIGHARHGKDTVADILADDYGYGKADSSRRSAEIFLFDKLKDKYGYKDIEECYLDRVNHRPEWFQEISEFNKHDKTRLARNILATSDIYVGMRCAEEIKACVAAKVFDFVVWVDACKRLPLEPESSFTIDASIADLIIDNNGCESLLRSKVAKALVYLNRKKLHDCEDRPTACCGKISC